ncbi:hypothetical protein IMZ11_37065 [Microtetraspora sp. AC03309]|uniref:hypothetical protein n=1 Tax=Microtetraspora sp. AC03309 TaxID=2779376 RepID=UPI001E54D51C|nr:hypothetical protein [Microtetraspora sp. AC03309]MCC5581233.1 hypothetical protein [Microtetraspora sp. AC03309]
MESFGDVGDDLLMAGTLEPAKRGGTGPGELCALPDDLEREVREFAGQLREIFGMLHMSLGQYAALNYMDKGALSRYLSGRRIPARPFLDGLLGELTKARGRPVTTEVREHLHDLHLRALESRDKQAFQVQVVTDQLATATTELRETRNQVKSLQEVLAAREQQVEELIRDSRQLRAAWADERERTQAEIGLLREQERERDQLLAEIETLQQRLTYARRRQIEAERRCRLLEAALESVGDPRAAEREEGATARDDESTESASPASSRSARRWPSGHQPMTYPAIERDPAPFTRESDWWPSPGDPWPEQAAAWRSPY